MKPPLGVLHWVLAAVVFPLSGFAVYLSIVTKHIRENDAALREQTQAVFQAAKRPILIHGFTIPLRLFAPEVEARSYDARPRSMQLVLVYSESCRACDAQRPIWGRVLADPRLADVETWVVELDVQSDTKPNSLVRTLQEHQMPYRVLRVQDKAAFSIATGIAATPLTMMTRRVGTETTVELLASGLASEEALNRFLEVKQSWKRSEETMPLEILVGTRNPL
jgi:hypothetical protein